MQIPKWATRIGLLSHNRRLRPAGALGAVLAVLLLLSAAGCGEPEQVPEDAPEQTPPGETDAGPARIISLMPSNTEILFALGLEEAVVGVTDWCDYPPALLEAVEAGRIRRVGDSFSMNEELVVSLEPDLVIFGDPSESSQALAGRLENLGISTLTAFPTNLEETLESILNIGEATGRLEEAQALVAEMESGVQAVTAESGALEEGEKPRVLVLLDLDSLFIAGPGTQEDELVRMAGGLNAMAATGYAQVSEEAIVVADPEVIICCFPFAERIFSEKAEWAQLTAVREGAVYDVDGNLVNRPAPRLTEGLSLLYTLLHVAAVNLPEPCG